MHETNTENPSFTHQPEIQAEIIDPDLSLKYRVGGRPGIPGSIRREAIEKAERAVHDLAKNYISVARGQIAEIMARFNHIRNSASGDQLAAYLNEISMIAREIKGQARSCGYDLLTDVADSLYSFISGRRQVNTRQIAFIEAHINVLQNIATYDLHRKGGDVGCELLNTITSARKKLEQN